MQTETNILNIKINIKNLFEKLYILLKKYFFVRFCVSFENVISIFNFSFYLKMWWTV